MRELKELLCAIAWGHNFYTLDKFQLPSKEWVTTQSCCYCKRNYFFYEFATLAEGAGSIRQSLCDDLVSNLLHPSKIVLP